MHVRMTSYLLRGSGIQREHLFPFVGPDPEFPAEYYPGDYPGEIFLVQIEAQWDEYDGRTGVAVADYGLLIAGAGEWWEWPESPYPAAETYMQFAVHTDGGDILGFSFPNGEQSWCELTDEFPLENGWVYQRWHVWSNPLLIPADSAWWMESTGPVLLDQIVFDCVPEPATLTLLALGGLLVARRRR